MCVCVYIISHISTSFKLLNLILIILIYLMAAISHKLAKALKNF